MKKFIFFLFCAVFSQLANSQNVTVGYNYVKKHDDKRTSLVGGRFEFLMSDKVVKLSFKIDKYNGYVYQLVEMSDGGLGWSKLKIQISDYDTKKDSSVNYQLYMSGIAARYCFLINVNTGVMWQLVESEEEELMFDLIE